MNEVLAHYVGILPACRVLDTASILTYILQEPGALGLFSKERLDNIKAGICQNKALRQGYGSMSLYAHRKVTWLSIHIHSG